MSKSGICCLLFIVFSLYANLSAADTQEKVVESLTEIGTTLPSDAEHYGALFDRTKPVLFYNSGRLGKGTLKNDYTVNGLVFAAGTDVNFYEHGSVSRGTLKNDAQYKSISIRKGMITLYQDGSILSCVVNVPFTDRNLTISTAGSFVQFDREGRVVSVDNDNTMSYPLLGRTVFRQAELVLNLAKTEYILFSGTLALPTLVAVIPTKRNTFGHPIQGETVVVPAQSNFKIFTTNPIYSEGQQNADTYSVPGSLTISGNNFGSNYPMLLVRDMRVVGVQIRQDLMIQGRQYKANDVVVFDAFGRVSHPPLP